jgi:signal transduction histidine kinase
MVATPAPLEPLAAPVPPDRAAAGGIHRLIRRGRRRSLRARLALTFAFAALVLSVVLSAVTYTLVRNNLIRQQERSNVDVAMNDANVARVQLLQGQSPTAIVQTRAAGQPFIYRDNEWVGSDANQLSWQDLPDTLRNRVISESPARQRFVVRGRAYLAVGTPIPAARAAYVETFELRDLERTLSILGGTLVGVSAVLTAAGAIVGFFLSRRVIRPLGVVARAASDIAGGRLDTRLDGGGDADLERLTSSFNRMADALQARIDRDARFASDVSHELRSPLTTLRTSLDLLASRRDELSDRGRTALDLLSADVRRFDQMVQDLLEISRFDAGAASANFEPIRFGELVLRSVEALTASSGTELPVEIDARVASRVVTGDKRRLERVVANLVQNARVHGGGAIRVAVVDGEPVRPGTVLLTVDDAGPGVPLADREQIFDRFARGAAARRRGSVEGTGLGLSIVAEHVRLHHGDVWVEDRPGGGARFVVALPVTEDG